ncbi:MAG: FMN-binding protein [Candidatus Stahlbacteria bacterium]|nr:MAG: FMN-binding protein [Candidatus Stahlbacteria bacterium]
MRLEVKMVLVLMGVALGSAGLLGLVFGVTAPVIVAQKEAARQNALAMLLPEAERFEPDTLISDGDTSIIYHAYDEKKTKIGIVFTVAPRGYGGSVETMVGLRADSTISAIRIASAVEGMRETAGLGARVLEDTFRNQFKGLKHDDLYLAKEGGRIDAITAATISSNAVTIGVREGVERHLPYLVEMAEREMTAQGYVGEFKVIVHLSKGGKITRIEIPLEGFNETTAIGTQCCEPGFLARFVGLSSAAEVKAVDAVSGATVTSEAVKEAVIQALNP